jgi:hypothetical protein
MSPARPLETALLAAAEDAMGAALKQLSAPADHPARLELLEAVACRIADFDLDAYRAVVDVSATIDSGPLWDAAAPVAAALSQTPIPPPQALSALAREPIAAVVRRRQGCYYTDFRLARFLADRAVAVKRPARGALVVDPASGSGALLVAIALSAWGPRRAALDDFVRHSACAADLSPTALRGARIALTPLARQLRSLEELAGRLRSGDSLLEGTSAWCDVAPDGFGLVIGNPPWEKLKLSRHEHLAALGQVRHYGDDYDVDHKIDGLMERRGELARYVRGLEYELAHGGEPDLYKLFLSLSSALVAEGGQIAMLVPAGLIRSRGATALRVHLLARTSELRVAVLDNRARFFPIDTRFKFLALNGVVDPTARATPMALEHASGTEQGVGTTASARLGRRQLRRIRPDLSVPEVRGSAEWALFRRLAGDGVLLGDPAGPWRLGLAREVDMTNDRAIFERSRPDGGIPLVEGRMVHQFRHTAKAYLTGTGRRALWVWQQPGEGELRPQFYVDPADLPDAVHRRAMRRRVGFCDITGQTNERSMLASSIPAGVVCGNKVPTIAFDEMGCDPELAAGLFLAIANSFVFDWLLRRVLTTTVNYFLLLSLPFPPLELDSAQAFRLAALAHQVERRYERAADPDGPALSTLRAEIDALAMQAYGIDPAEADLIFRDFPLLDRGQPALAGEPRPTVTRDVVLLELERNMGGAVDDALAQRIDDALATGADPYVPSQLAGEQRYLRGMTVA